jgi:hypothetical protein
MIAAFDALSSISVARNRLRAMFRMVGWLELIEPSIEKRIPRYASG